MKLYSAKTSQAIDRDAIKNHDIAGILLMKRAAWFSLQTLQNQWPKANAVHIVCGTGNNGGDGFALAQYALINGYNVHVSILGNAEKITGDARTTYNEMMACGMTVKPLTKNQLHQCDVIVDAIFGTGLNQTVSGEYASIIELINHSKKPILSLDMPSGVHADTGHIMGSAICADHTCTFITHKIGLYTSQGQEQSGQVHFSNLFLSKAVYKNHLPLAQNHKLKYWLNHLPHRQAAHHKGSAGTLCLIGGNISMMGAIQLAGLASLKAGCGLTKVITRTAHATAITQAIPELMCYQKNHEKQVISSAKALAIGPGLGKDQWATERFMATINSSLPKVIDADALRILAEKDLNKLTPNWVLTPHPGEAAELLGVSNHEIQMDRVASIKALHAKFGGVIILKGNGTLIFEGKQLEICLAGNAGMAVGGMGDVLTGAIGSLLAQGLPLWEAANLGVSLHAHAADILAKQHGEPSILPSEVAQTISQLMAYKGSANTH